MMRVPAPITYAYHSVWYSVRLAQTAPRGCAPEAKAQERGQTAKANAGTMLRQQSHQHLREDDHCEEAAMILPAEC